MNRLTCKSGLQKSHQIGCDYVTAPLGQRSSTGCAKFCNATRRVSVIKSLPLQPFSPQVIIGIISRKTPFLADFLHFFLSFQHSKRYLNSVPVVDSFACTLICVHVSQVPQCCEGFYGPDCKPCIGGFQHPCYDKGKVRNKHISAQARFLSQALIQLPCAVFRRYRW